LVVLYVIFVCLFFCSVNDFSATRWRFTPKFARRRSLGRDVTSPFLGVGGPRRAEKGANEIFVTMGVNGNFFAFWRFLSDISATRAQIHTKYVGTMSVDVPPPPVGSIGHGGRGGGVKNSKNGRWSHSCCGQLPFYFYQRCQMWSNM